MFRARGAILYLFDCLFLRQKFTVATARRLPLVFLRLHPQTSWDGIRHAFQYAVAFSRRVSPFLRVWLQPALRQLAEGQQLITGSSTALRAAEHTHTDAQRGPPWARTCQRELLVTLASWRAARQLLSWQCHGQTRSLLCIQP